MTSPISTAYRGIFDTMLKAAEQVGFINNRPSFYVFKEQLKEQIGAYTLTSEQHKFIDRSLFLYIMSRPNSPLKSYFSPELINRLYTNPSDNIATTLVKIKDKYSSLKNNIFVSNLQPSSQNQKQGQTIIMYS